MDEHLKRIREDVDEMSKALDTPEGAGTEVPRTEPASTDAPKTEAAVTETAVTDAPKTDAPKTEVPGTSAPKTEAPATEAPVEDESEKLRKENESLRARLNELSGTREKPKISVPKTTAPTTETPIEAINFLKDLDLDEVTRSPEEFNKLLNVVYSKGLNTFEKTSVEKLLRSLPDIVRTNILTINSLRESSEEFYKDNEDLLPFRKVVALTFEEIASENPDKKYVELFEDVAKESRKKLELYNKATKKVDDKGRHPILPHRKSQQRQKIEKPNITPIESEIDEMNSSLSS